MLPLMFLIGFLSTVFASLDMYLRKRADKYNLPILVMGFTMLSIVLYLVIQNNP